MASQLHKHFRAVAQKAFQRYGFAYAEILAHWREIAGKDLAAYSEPERIRWPRQPDSGMSGRGRKNGGTLVIRVTDGRAVELQHETARIVDRVNTYYGYEAITGVKLVQGPLPRPPEAKKRRPELDPERERALNAELEGIEDEALRAALLKLGRGALAAEQMKKDNRSQ